MFIFIVFEDEYVAVLYRKRKTNTFGSERSDYSFVNERKISEKARED